MMSVTLPGPGQPGSGRVERLLESVDSGDQLRRQSLPEAREVIADLGDGGPPTVGVDRQDRLEVGVGDLKAVGVERVGSREASDRRVDGLRLSVDALETSNLFNHISVENTIVDLDVTGEKKAIPTLVREVQVHPFKPDILHVDFYKIQKGVEVEVNVPLHLEGTPSGVKNHGGVLQQPHHEQDRAGPRE